MEALLGLLAETSCRKVPPPNLIRTRFLQGLFPEARFLIILRHPTAVAYATRKFFAKNKKKIGSLMAHSFAGYRILAADLPHLKKTMVIRYEDFVQNPDELLDSLYQFVGLPPRKSNHQIRPDVNSEYFKQWDQDCQSITRGYFLKKILKDRSIHQQAQHLGYSLKDGGVSQSPPALEELAAFGQD